MKADPFSRDPLGHGYEAAQRLLFEARGALHEASEDLCAIVKARAALDLSTTTDVARAYELAWSRYAKACAAYCRAVDAADAASAS